MKAHRRIFKLVLLGLAGVITACASQSIKRAEKGDMRSKNRVLVAGERSEFKDAVIARVVQALEKEACYVKLMDVDDLTGESTKPYRAVVLVNSCWFWRLRRPVLKFLAKAKEKEKVILLTTAGNDEWREKDIRVDAITSASKMSKAKGVAETLVEKVRGRLGR
jgi:hypothetical protein